MISRVRSDRRERGGFTLIEIMIAIGILALLISGVTMGARAIAKSELRGKAAKIAGAMRFAFDRATTTGRYYRLTFHIEDRKVTTEVSDDRFYMTRTAKAESERKDRQREHDEAQQEAAPDDPTSLGALEVDLFPRAEPARFEAFQESGFKPIALGKVEIDGIWTPRWPDPVSEGQAHIYYFPQGFGEHVVVHLGHGDDAFSLMQHPLTGRVKVLPGKFEIDVDDQEVDDLGERTL